MVMKIGHPSGQPLSEEQQLVLQSFQHRLESMVSSQGLTSEQVQELVQELRAHPLISAEIMQEIRQELSRLMPNQRFRFD
jgi:RNA-binding protein YhbY